MFPDTYRILVVDDLADNLLLLDTVLQAEGYTVDLANSGKAALSTIIRSSPDLILLDLMMPEMNGIEVTCQIRQDPKYSHIPILLVTAHEDASAIAGLANGANALIRKPIDFDALLSTVKRFLQLKEGVTLNRP